MALGTAILHVHDPHQVSPPLPISSFLGHARCSDNLSPVFYRVTCWCSRAGCANPGAHAARPLPVGNLSCISLSTISHERGNGG